MNRVIIVQIPSQALPENMINERIADENAAGWVVRQMMDHNGFLVLLMEPAPVDRLRTEPPNAPSEPTEADHCAFCGGYVDAMNDEAIARFYRRNGGHGDEIVWCSEEHLKAWRALRSGPAVAARRVRPQPPNEDAPFDVTTLTEDALRAAYDYACARFNFGGPRPVEDTQSQKEK